MDQGNSPPPGMYILPIKKYVGDQSELTKIIIHQMMPLNNELDDGFFNMWREESLPL